MVAYTIIEREELRNRSHVFRDRSHAGAILTEMLAARFGARPDTTVLAIPAGGVPVAAPIARQLALPLDIVAVSKITLPWSSEAGFGAVAFDGSVHLDDALVRELGLSEEQVEAGVVRTREKVARRNGALRGDRGYSALMGRDMILVDDGVASGVTLVAAIAALRAIGAASIIVAVPTAHRSSARLIAGSVEAFYCANVRAGYRFAVADAYRSWWDVDEETARTILAAFQPAAHRVDGDP